MLPGNRRNVPKILLRNYLSLPSQISYGFGQIYGIPEDNPATTRFDPLALLH
jgi:hypothetical protein